MDKDDIFMVLIFPISTILLLIVIGIMLPSEIHCYDDNGIHLVNSGIFQGPMVVNRTYTCNLHNLETIEDYCNHIKNEEKQVCINYRWGLG